MSESAVAQEAPKTGLAKIPGKAWGMLFLALFTGIAVPLNMFKCPPVAAQIMAAFGLDPSTFGWTMTIYTVMGIVLAFPAAGIIKKIGDKNGITLALACTVIGTAIGLFATNVTMLLIGRFVEGISMGIIAVAAPVAIGKWFPRHKRGLAMGIWAPWVPIGNVIMFNVANPLADSFGGWQAVWWFGLIYALIFLVLWVLIYRSPEKPIMDDDEAEEMATRAASEPKKGIKAYAVPTMWLLAIGFFCFNVTFQGSCNTFYTEYCTSAHGMLQAEGAFMTSYMTILAIFGQPFAGWLADKLGTRKWVVFVGYVAILVSTIWLFNWTENWQMWVATTIAGFIGSFIAPNMWASAAEVMGPEEAEKGTAILSFMQNCGSFVGGIALGYLQASMGWAMGSFVLFIPLLIVAIITLLLAKDFK